MRPPKLSYRRVLTRMAAVDMATLLELDVRARVLMCNTILPQTLAWHKAADAWMDAQAVEDQTFMLERLERARMIVERTSGGTWQRQASTWQSLAANWMIDHYYAVRLKTSKV